jgi:hypothetical protein
MDMVIGTRAARLSIQERTPIELALWDFGRDTVRSWDCRSSIQIRCV